MFKRILIGCGVLVGVAVLAVFIFIGFFSYRIATPEKVIQEFHASLVLGDFDQAYACLSATAKSKMSKHEFITEMSSLVPFEFAEEYREEMFKKTVRLAEMEIITSDIQSNQASVEVRIALPAERAIKELLMRDTKLASMKAESDSLQNISTPGTKLIYNKVGKFMLAVLDSLNTERHKKLFQYYDVKKVTVYLEFESGGWKIKEGMW